MKRFAWILLPVLVSIAGCDPPPAAVSSSDSLFNDFALKLANISLIPDDTTHRLTITEETVTDEPPVLPSEDSDPLADELRRRIFGPEQSDSTESAEPAADDAGPQEDTPVAQQSPEPEPAAAMADEDRKLVTIQGQTGLLDAYLTKWNPQRRRIAWSGNGPISGHLEWHGVKTMNCTDDDLELLHGAIHNQGIGLDHSPRNTTWTDPGTAAATTVTGPPLVLYGQPLKVDATYRVRSQPDRQMIRSSTTVQYATPQRTATRAVRTRSMRRVVRGGCANGQCFRR